MDETPKTRKRLPRAKRVTEDARPPMVLTDRDRDIVATVNAYQALLGKQLERLFFSSRSTAQYRLQRLYQHEFLDRHFMTVVSTAPAASPMIYTLGKRGAYLLAQEMGFEPAQLRRFPKVIKWQFMEHLLAINEVRVAISLACHANGFTLEEWLDEPVFRGAPEYVRVTDGKGKTSEKPVFPDGYFRIKTRRGTAHCFLEVDRATEQQSKFRPQVEVYETYVASGQYQARFSPKSMRVLIVTTTSERLQNLKKTVASAGGDEKYWFTTLAQVTEATVLTAPIWEQLGNTTKKAWLG
jgi:hypothetical protein